MDASQVQLLRLPQNLLWVMSLAHHGDGSKAINWNKAVWNVHMHSQIK
jgi:hypothetical protein